jgi:carotenoid cleavage dioxygenase
MAQLFPNHPNLRGGFAPLQMECDVHDLIIEGEVPKQLNGTFYRNGPNPQYSPRGTYQMFGGDGMIHALSIEDGRVSYRNRWVRTQRFEKEREAGRSLFNSFNPMDVDESVQGMETDGVGNTNIIWHGGKLLVLEEAHIPIELDPISLETKGGHTFNDRLHGPMTAHPKMDEETGEMFFFGYNAKGGISEHMTFSVVDAGGTVIRSEAFVAPYASMVHDFMVTEEHILFPIMPLTGSMERAFAGGPVYAWEPEKGVHIGVMPRTGSVKDLRWFRGAPSYVFHPMNSYTDGNKIICDVCEYPEAPLFPLVDGSRGDPKKALAKMVRWTFDLDSETDVFKEEQLHDIVCEFPRFDERLTGMSYRYGYFAGDTQPPEKVGGFNVIGAVDHKTNSLDLYDVGEGCATGEPIFVPISNDAAEGEGFLLAHVYDANRAASHLAILDAQNVTAGPLAKAYLDHRIPYGFHGNWRGAQ